MAIFNYVARTGADSSTASAIRYWLANDIAEVIVSGASVTDITGNEDLIVYGSITKSAVVSGAGTMGYSGFDVANYMQHAHSSSLEFGTGNFSLGAWFITASAATNEMIIDISDTSYASARIDMLKASNNKLRFLLEDDDGTNTIHNSSAVVGNNEWHHAIAVRTSTLSYMYIDGKLDSTHSCATIQNVTNYNSVAKVGQGHSDVRFRGSLALVRVYDTALSSAQVKKIYDNEKILFKTDRVFTIVDSTASTSIELNGWTPESKTIREVNKSISGKRVVNKDRTEKIYSVETTNLIPISGLDAMRRFLDSVSAGSIFQIDPFETGDNIDLKLTSDGYTEKRLNTENLFGFSFEVIEV